MCSSEKIKVRESLNQLMHRGVLEKIRASYIYVRHQSHLCMWFAEITRSWKSHVMQLNIRDSVTTC